MSFFRKLFSPPSKAPIIDGAIVHLSKQPSIMGTAYKEISYSDVVEYIRERGCKIDSQVDKGNYTWYNFTATIAGKSHEVWLDKTSDGNGSVLTVPPK